MTDSQSTPPFSFSSFLGETLLEKVGKKEKKTADLMKGKELVLLYFSAKWCGPCRAFSPLLTDFYNKYAKSEKLEIVYVSSDNSIEEFEEYYKKMPWLAISPVQGSAVIKRKLAETFGIMGIPTLVVMTSTGEFITSSAREEVTKAGKDNGKTVIQTWKSTEPKPLSEATSMSNGGGGILYKLLMYFARNPMHCVALVYLYKWAVRKYNTLGAEENPEL